MFNVTGLICSQGDARLFLPCNIFFRFFWGIYCEDIDIFMREVSDSAVLHKEIRK